MSFRSCSRAWKRGCATAAWRYLYEPGVTSLMLVVGLWCLFNLVIAGAALGQPFANPTIVRGVGHLGDTGVDEWATAVLTGEAADAFLGTQGDHTITADEWAGWGETITWEVLCGVGARVPRIAV